MKYNFIVVTPERYGVNCYMFYGFLDNGNWFYVTDSWDYSYITTKDLSEYIYDESFERLCIENLVNELEGDEEDDFRRDMIEWLINHNHEEFISYYNTIIIQDWLQIGGVLGYDAFKCNPCLYIMDDGEFNDMWKDQCRLHCYVDGEITEENFARLLCKTALERVKYSKKEIEELMIW